MGMPLTFSVYMVSILNFNCSQLVTRLLVIISIVAFEAVNTEKSSWVTNAVLLCSTSRNHSLLSHLKIKTIVIQILNTKKCHMLLDHSSDYMLS